MKTSGQQKVLGNNALLIIQNMFSRTQRTIEERTRCLNFKLKMFVKYLGLYIQVVRVFSLLVDIDTMHKDTVALLAHCLYLHHNHNRRNRTKICLFCLSVWTLFWLLTSAPSRLRTLLFNSIFQSTSKWNEKYGKRSQLQLCRRTNAALPQPKWFI